MNERCKRVKGGMAREKDSEVAMRRGLVFQSEKRRDGDALKESVPFPQLWLFFFFRLTYLTILRT